ncbi:MAG: hypothetical protein ACYSR0_11055 [Planctomycetota bacterium]
MLVFMVHPAMAAKPENVIDNKSNVFQSDKLYALNITGKSGNDKEATTITELQTDVSLPSNIDGNESSMEQIRMIMLLLLVYQDPGKLYR